MDDIQRLKKLARNTTYGVESKRIREYKELSKEASRKSILLSNTLYYNQRSMDAFEAGDFDTAADYAELVRRNLERLAAMS